MKSADELMKARLRRLVRQRARQHEALDATDSELADMMAVAVRILGWSAERVGGLTGFTARQVRDQI